MVREILPKYQKYEGWDGRTRKGDWGDVHIGSRALITGLQGEKETEEVPTLVVKIQAMHTASTSSPHHKTPKLRRIQETLSSRLTGPFFYT